MKARILKHWYGIVFIVLAVIYYAGIPSVPFHPDETSYLFQSQEFEILISNPISLAWQPEMEIDPLLRYRLLDAPLHRYSIGLGLRIAGYRIDSLPNDWNWSSSWEENVSAGALPETQVLNTARFIATTFSLGSILFLFLFVKKLANIRVGIIAALLFGFSSLTLLHGRRAMAEGLLLFGLCLALWSLSYAGKRPWITGICMAIAFSAKYSLAVLVLVGLIAVIWLSAKGKLNSKIVYANSAIYLFTFGIIVLILHPVLWLHPFLGLQEMYLSRAALSNQGVLLLNSVCAQFEFKSIGEKMIALLAQTFIAPPAFSDYGNYLANTANSVLSYTKNPLNNLLRGFVTGGGLLILAIFGFVLKIKNLKKFDLAKRSGMILFIGITLLLGLSLILVIPFPIQRYYLPLLPILMVWVSLGISAIQIHPSN